jgi:hypothetical protein
MHSQASRSTLAGKSGTGCMKGLEQIGTRAFFRPAGTMTVEQGVRLVADAIRAARVLRLDDMLVDITGATGFGPPGVFERYEMGASWASAAGAHFCVAIVSRPELIDPQKIGTVVAQNRNAIIDVFNNEADALAWLDARLGATYRGRRPDAIDES